MDAAARELSSDEDRAWRALMRLSVILPRVIDDDLRADSGLQLTSHGVLLHLSESAGLQMRMSELAERTAMSPSRITRVVQSLAADGLVVQTACPGDGRSSMAQLTPAGRERLEAATPAHRESIRARALDHIPADQLAVFAETVGALLDGLTATPPSFCATDRHPGHDAMAPGIRRTA